MKKSLLAMVMLLFVLSEAFCWTAENGEIRVSADIKDAYISVNGKDKGMTGEGYTSILLPEGVYYVRVEKKSDDGKWIYYGIRKVYLSSGRSVKIDIKTEKLPYEQFEKKRKEFEDAVKNAFKELPNQFVKIQPGTFMMGSPDSEPKRENNEKQHKVTLTRPFYMQKTEVTQAQWQAVMGENPSDFNDCGANCPVENVAWNNVQNFIKKLNQITGKKYRLPTEAEWEYACRAGTTTSFSFGKCLSADQANYNGTSPLEGCFREKNRKTPVPVASFPPNAWGLYDMHGNVLEWCQDWHGEYPSESITDPIGPDNGSERVVRGGCWFSIARNCRSAVRSGIRPYYRHYGNGFRLAFSADQ